jgi:hypothetical protein
VTVANLPDDTFLRVAEYWRYHDTTNSLSLAGRFCANHPNSSEPPQAGPIPLGAGLIGRCAQLNTTLSSEGVPSGNEVPVANGEFDFARESVRLAIPWQTRVGQRGVLALFFARSFVNPSGGVEVWTRNTRSEQLALSYAFHGIAEDFRRVSSLFTFAIGEGLPGRIVQRKRPESLRIAENTREFLRAVAAETSGFVQALGFPVPASNDTAIVILGHRRQPIAEQIDVWEQTHSGQFERSTDPSLDPPKPLLFDVAPQLKQAAHSGTPVIFTNLDDASDGCGGIVLPFESADGASSLCTLIWSSTRPCTR